MKYALINPFPANAPILYPFEMGQWRLRLKLLAIKFWDKFIKIKIIGQKKTGFVIIEKVNMFGGFFESL